MKTSEKEDKQKHYIEDNKNKTKDTKSYVTRKKRKGWATIKEEI